MPDISWNFTDAQGRCFIAGREVPSEVYREFEAGWDRAGVLEAGIRNRDLIVDALRPLVADTAHICAFPADADIADEWTEGMSRELADAVMQALLADREETP